MMLNQNQALAAPRRSVSTAGAANSASGGNRISAYKSRAPLSSDSMTKVTAAPVTGSAMAGVKSCLRRTIHSRHAASNHSGHVCHGSMRA